MEVAFFSFLSVWPGVLNQKEAAPFSGAASASDFPAALTRVISGLLLPVTAYNGCFPYCSR